MGGQGRGAGFAAEVDEAYLRQFAFDQTHQRRHRMQDRDVVAIQGGHQGFGVADDFRRCDPNRGADEIADPDLFERHVEGHGEALIDDIIAADAEYLVLAAEEMADAPLTDGDALGRAGGARRVDHVGRIFRRSGPKLA